MTLTYLTSELFFYLYKKSDKQNDILKYGFIILIGKYMSTKEKSAERSI